MTDCLSMLIAQGQSRAGRFFLRSPLRASRLQHLAEALNLRPRWRFQVADLQRILCHLFPDKKPPPTEPAIRPVPRQSARERAVGQWRHFAIQ